MPLRPEHGDPGVWSLGTYISIVFVLLFVAISSLWMLTIGARSEKKEHIMSNTAHVEKLKRIKELGGECVYTPPAIQPIDPAKRGVAVLTDLANLGLIELTIKITPAGEDYLRTFSERENAPPVSHEGR